jgi:hypothetical protein
MPVNKEMDRWDKQNFFGQLPPLPPEAERGSPVVRGAVPKEIMEGATTLIWQLAARNRKDGHTPVISPNTLLSKKG